MTAFHKLIKFIFAATYRDEQGGAGQLPCVEGAGEHQVQAGAAAVSARHEGQRGEVTSSTGNIVVPRGKQAVNSTEYEI